MQKIRAYLSKPLWLFFDMRKQHRPTREGKYDGGGCAV